jgi:deoxyribodipyrimidine photolyase-like uncharacterized protein
MVSGGAVDAFEWVEAQYQDEPVRRWRAAGVKTYAASGAYINRMSNYCDGASTVKTALAQNTYSFWVHSPPTGSL